MLQMKKIYKTLLKKKFITIKRNNDKLQIFLKQKNTKVKSGGSAMAQLTEIGKLDKEVYENNARITEYLVSLGKLYDIIVNKTDNITSGEITELSKQLGLKEESVIALNTKVLELQSKIKEDEKKTFLNINLSQELKKKVNEQEKVIKKKIADLKKNEEVNIDLTKGKRNFEKKILDLKKKNAELKKKISAMNLLETKLITLQKERSQLITESDVYKQESDRYQQERDVYKQKSDRYQQERDRYQQQRDGYKQERDRYQQQRDGYKQERDEYKQERDEIIKRLDQEKIELGKAREELKDVKTELRTATKSKGKSGKESPAKLRKRIENLEYDIRSSENNAKKWQTMLQKCNNRWVKKNPSRAPRY